MANYQKLYKTSEVCEILGLERSTIQYYCDREIITPVKEASGRGSYRQFSPRNVVEIAISKHLVESGIPLKELPCSLESLNENIEDLRRQESDGYHIPVNDYLDPMKPQSFAGRLIMCVNFDAPSIKERKVSWVRVFRYNYNEPESLDYLMLGELSFLWVNLSVMRDEVESRLKNYQQKHQNS